MELSEFKEHLALNIESTADWRSSKAEEYPDDERNKIAAEGLRRFASGVAALPDDHPDLKRVWWEWYRPRTGGDVDFCRLSEAESEFFRRYCFDHASDDLSDFLKALADSLNEAGLGNLRHVQPESQTQH